MITSFAFLTTDMTHRRRFSIPCILFSVSTMLAVAPATAAPWDAIKEKITHTIEEQLQPADSRKAHREWAEKELKELTELIQLYSKAKNAAIREKAEKRTEKLLAEYSKVYTSLRHSKKKEQGYESIKVNDTRITLKGLEPHHGALRKKRAELYEEFQRASRQCVKRSRDTLQLVRPIGCILRTHLVLDFKATHTDIKTPEEAARIWVEKEISDLRKLLTLLPDSRKEDKQIEAIALMEHMLDSYAPLYPGIRKHTPLKVKENTKYVSGVAIAQEHLDAPHRHFADERAALYVNFMSCKGTFQRSAPAYSTYMEAIETILRVHQEERATEEKSKFTRKRAQYFGR